MGVIWIIEPHGTQSEDRLEDISANFPVRKFSSLAHVRLLFETEKSALKPDLIFINDALTQDSLHAFGLSQLLLSLNCMVAVSNLSSNAWKDVAKTHGFPVLEVECAVVLSSQLKALLARSTLNLSSKLKVKDTPLDFGDVTFCRKTATVTIFGQGSETLLPKEAQVLELLAQFANEIVPRETIAQLVWNGVHVSRRSLDTHISRMRQKISHSSLCEIESVYGKGYRLTVNNR